MQKSSLTREPRKGIEPATSPPLAGHSNPKRDSGILVRRSFSRGGEPPFLLACRAIYHERDTGVEPVSLPWEGSVEPLN